MILGDPMNPFSAAELAKSNRPEDGGQDHPWAMNPSHGLVQTDQAVGFGFWDLWSANGKVGAGEIQACGQNAQSGVHIAARRAAGQAVMAFGAGASDDRSDHRDGG